MTNKYYRYGYFTISLFISIAIHFGAKTFVEFAGTTLVTFLFFIGIYYCFKNISTSKLSHKIFKGIGVILLVVLIYASYLFASFRQFNSYACKPDLFGVDIITKQIKLYCNFIPWYTRIVFID